MGTATGSTATRAPSTAAADRGGDTPGSDELRAPAIESAPSAIASATIVARPRAVTERG
jgi:hypothetical protein